MAVLRLVIIEKCEVKDIAIGQIMTMATRVDIFFFFANYFSRPNDCWDLGSHKYCSGDK